jgi:putative oxidoreductase
MKLKRVVDWLVVPPTRGPWALVFIRLMAGGVFLWEGIGKFYFPSLGVARFTAIGLPMPEIFSVAIAMLEIVGGIGLIAGILTRPISILFIGEMIGVVLTTKVSLFLGQSPLPLPPVPPQFGMWAVLHDARSDYAQFMTALMLLCTGPGTLSLDAYFASKRTDRAVMASAMARG